LELEKGMGRKEKKRREEKERRWVVGESGGEWGNE
jgi:hypothetical protein